MTDDETLVLGNLLRRAGPPTPVAGFAGVQIDDPRLAEVLAQDAPLLQFYEAGVHGEGPVWAAAEERLYWSDVPNRRLLALDPDGRVTAAIDGTYFMNGNAIDADGHLIHCEHGRRCISRSENPGWPGPGQPKPIVTHYEGKRINTPNDVVVADDGAIWFTDPVFGLLMPNQGALAEPELDHRSVYRFDPATKELRRMADFEQPNGLFFAPNGRTLYVSDTALSLNDVPGDCHGRTHEIQAFDVAADGGLSNRRLFYQTDHGVPDGFAVDSRGWVWTTAGDGVHVIAPDGRRLGYIPTPAVCANCAFGGRDGNRLFIAATQCLFAIDIARG